jgi:8-oxo-dGTP diphosphatase
MIRYCVGFLFDGQGSESVALILKRRPAWQNGLLNGIGGHVEHGETPEAAMAREAMEEAGVEVPADKWRLFARLVGPNEEGDEIEVSCFTAVKRCNLKQVSDEKVAWYNANVAGDGINVVPSLRWMIPMAMDNQSPHIMAVVTGCRR